MLCPSCNHEVASGSKFCNHCGTKIEAQGKTCPKPGCGRSGLPPEALYCPDCGAIIPSDCAMAQKELAEFESQEYPVLASRLQEKLEEFITEGEKKLRSDFLTPELYHPFVEKLLNEIGNSGASLSDIHEKIKKYFISAYINLIKEIIKTQKHGIISVVSSEFEILNRRLSDIYYRSIKPSQNLQEVTGMNMMLSRLKSSMNYESLSHLHHRKVLCDSVVTPMTKRQGLGTLLNIGSFRMPVDVDILDDLNPIERYLKEMLYFHNEIINQVVKFYLELMDIVKCGSSDAQSAMVKNTRLQISDYHNEIYGTSVTP